MDTSTPKPVSWHVASRRVSSCDSKCSLPPSAPSNEQCALMNFAYRLGSIVKNNDPSIVDNIDVRREAKLLMSLSYPSWEMLHEETTKMNTKSSGRITPPSRSSSASSTASNCSGGSRRDSFCFTCPSLSLDNDKEGERIATPRDGESCYDDGECVSPATMLSRTLRVDDRDAMRLSSDAMARNIMQSFQKAMRWRIQAWVTSLARVLVIKERELKEQGASEETIQALLHSDEALLVATLHEITPKVQVLEASTSFKVMHKVHPVSDPADSHVLKKHRCDEEERNGLQEGEYIYDVAHVLEMQAALKVSTPAGNIHIDLNVPGIMTGTFLSSEQNYEEELTDVNLQLNTAMMATMIDKSSRIAVRASAEALLKGEYLVEARAVANKETKSEVAATNEQEDLAEPLASATSREWATQTTTPKRKFSDDMNPVSGIMVITPRDASSPSSYGDSDSDGDNSTGKPVRLQIPDNFCRQKGGAVIYPQPSRARAMDNFSFATRLPPKKSLQPTAVVTPLKTADPQFEYREKGPNLPVLVEVACAAMDAKK